MASEYDEKVLGITNRKILGTLILLTAFLGQVYFQPFSVHFRFSLSVPALALILLYFPFGSPILYSLVAGITMFTFRVLLSFLSQGAGALGTLMLQHIPVLGFYLVFGILFSFFKIRERKNSFLLLFISLWVCEIVANVTELLLVKDGSVLLWERAVFVVIIVGGVRSGATAAAYKLSMLYLSRYDRRRREEQYCQMMLFFSNIKTDLLFFRKSGIDIERAMKLSYSLYEKLEEGPLREESLSIARNIHEIKKDYQRISASMERALSEEYRELPMKMSEIFYILEQNTRCFLLSRNSAVTVRFGCNDDWVADDFYIIISVINNLVVNATEAMESSGKGDMITVNHWLDTANCFLEVRDNGPGIDEELLDYIFEPGFTTKFDPATGEMSTGLGLVHVRHVVQDFFGGSVHVTSSDNGTVFRIVLPRREELDESE